MDPGECRHAERCRLTVESRQSLIRSSSLISLLMQSALALMAFAVYHRAFGSGVYTPLYESSHPWWHLLSGVGTLCLYLPGMI